MKCAICLHLSIEADAITIANGTATCAMHLHIATRFVSNSGGSVSFALMMRDYQLPRGQAPMDGGPAPHRPTRP